MNTYKKSYLYLSIAILTGILTGIFNLSFLVIIAETVSTLFTNFLQLIAAPVVFLSIVSTLTGMKGLDEMRSIGQKVFSYTILTTLLATVSALALFILLDPVSVASQPIDHIPVTAPEGSYLSFFVNIVPSNFFKAFLDNNVIAIAFMAFLFGIASLKLPEENKEFLNQLFSSLFKLILKITGFVIVFMPIGIWAFTALLVQDLRHNFSHFYSLILYLVCVLGANLVQGFIVLPLVVKWKGGSPSKLAMGSSEALILAFFSKSSNATLPVTLRCAENKLGISTKIANFSLPLCTVINMNGCAAFILTTVLFVSGVHGHHYSLIELIMWMGLSTLAAVGNAGVPMGCFFLASTFLIGLNVPLTTMGLILPFYAFLDMVETSLNVWSDICVTSIVDKEVRQEIDSNLLISQKVG